MTNAERNASICALYKSSGLTMVQLGNRFHLSAERIRQILKDAGLGKEDRIKIVNPDSAEFLGVNVPKDVKLALRKEAKKQGLSMSSITTKTLRDMLKTCGYKLQGNKITEIVTT